MQDPPSASAMSAPSPSSWLDLPTTALEHTIKQILIECVEKIMTSNTPLENINNRTEKITTAYEHPGGR